MATVYLARDVRHGRDVAVKVLRPELTAALGPERFLREITIVAGLRHPHILPLYDSGEADGFLYYVMPYVSGESLRDRLTREKQLPIDEALKIGREVADALSFAHSQGIVHRDIKPENILLEAGHAVVTDFGIARAVSAAGGERLTETGIAIGTPTYMSPEQASGSGDVDARSDIYALACVVYELLAGEPPFTGATVESVLHQHLTAPAPPVTAIRAAVSPAVVGALVRALAKAPADRFVTASQFADALEGPTTGLTRSAAGTRPFPSVRQLVATAAVAVLAIAAYLAWPRAAPPVDESIVAVLPFRVVSDDASLAYLREGMVDLLAAKLTGEGGPRAVDPRTALRAWERAAGSLERDLAEDEAIAVARRVGAGEVLLGSVVGTARRIELHARLVGVTDLAARSQNEVSGSPDSIPWLLDALVAQLLARRAGETELVQLTSTSLQALRSYLDGQAAYRRGQYHDAAGHFSAALDADSTFALAGLGLVAANYWATTGFDVRGRNVAWIHRDRLSARDRALAEAIAAPALPKGTYRDQLNGFRRATELAPDRPEPWYWLGEAYFHFGAALQITSSQARAADAFGRALALDSSFVVASEHMLDLSAAAGNPADAERIARHHLAIDSTGDLADYVRWKLATVIGDSAWLAEFENRLEGVSTPSLRAITGEAVLRGFGFAVADPAAEALARRAAPPSERFVTLMRIRTYYLNRGWPARARALDAHLEEVAPAPGLVSTVAVLDALFGGGGPSVSDALTELGRLGASPRGDYPACVNALWGAARGDFDDAPAVIEAFGAQPNQDPDVLLDDRVIVAAREVCAITLSALLAAHRSHEDRDAALARLDSLMSQAPGAPYPIASAANLTAAHLHEERGDLEAAMAAVRLGVRHYGTYESTFLREEGRLAELLGDDEAAIHAYQSYLALRSHPEPAVMAEVEGVRQALARLLREPGS